MRKLPTLAKTGLVAAAALTAAVGVSAAPASAAITSWTVAGGGSFSATSTNSVLTDTATGTQLKCTTSTATGSATNGTYSSGAGIASIGTINWSNCSGPLGIKFNVTPSNLPWHLNAVNYSAGVTTGTLTGVLASISGFGCTASFAGPTSTTPATLNVKYTNATHTLTVLGTGDLHAYGVSGTCVGLLNSGDPASYTGDYVLTPPTLTITGS